MPATTDVIIVGGGAIGCAIARALALAGRRVVVCEKNGQPGLEASAAAAGLIHAQGEAHTGPFLDLCLAGRDGFEGFVRAVERESGCPTGYGVPGLLVLAMAPDDETRLRRWAETQRGPGRDTEWLDAAAVRQRAPGVSPAIRAGLFLPRESALDCGPFAAAIARAAVVAGAELRTDTPVAALDVAGGRVRGVRTVAGARLEAGHVVLAAGAWSAFGDTLPCRVPVAPAKGQMLAVEGTLGLSCPVERQGIYLVPRPDGRTLVGSTVEDVGFDKSPTAGGVQSLLAGALAIVPAVRGARLVATWAGLRPRTPDGWPLLGPVPGVEGLLLATGHFRNGILLAPITAEIVRGLVCDGRSPVALEPFRVDRFAAAPKEAVSVGRS